MLEQVYFSMRLLLSALALFSFVTLTTSNALSQTLSASELAGYTPVLPVETSSRPHIKNLSGLTKFFAKTGQRHQAGWSAKIGPESSLVVRILDQAGSAKPIDMKELAEAIRNVSRRRTESSELLHVSETMTFVPAADWEGARAALDLTPIGTTTMDDGQTAVILKNMTTIKKGDIVSVIHDERVYRWEVEVATKDIIELKKLDVN